MFQRILATLIIGLSVAAHAQDDMTASTGGPGGIRSEHFFQSAAGESNVTGRLGYENLTTTGKEPDADEFELKGLNPVSVEYEYGINDMFSVGGNIGYMNLDSDTAEYSGLVNPNVFLKGTSVLEFGRLRYGASVGLGFMKREFKRDGDKGTVAPGSGLFSPGGLSVTPYIGTDIDLGPGILGARLSFLLPFKHTWEFKGDDNREADVEGGETVAATVFY